MATARRGHHAESLTDGTILVAGGLDATGTPLTSAEVYDTRSRQWTSAGSMHSARAAFGMAALADGRVLVSGGFNPTGPQLASAELYTP